MNFNINYVSNSLVVAGNAIDPLLTTQQISRAANLTRRFRWGNVTLGGTRRLNVSDGSGAMPLPSLTVTPSPIALGSAVTWAPRLPAVNDIGFKTRQPAQYVVGGGVLGTVIRAGQRSDVVTEPPGSQRHRIQDPAAGAIRGGRWRDRHRARHWEFAQFVVRP